jgi:hypothetical protein
MSDPNLNELILRSEEAAAFIATQEDEVVRNLLRIAVATVGRRVAIGTNVSREEWAHCLPRTPFDMLFFVQTLARMFSNPALLRRVMDGETIAKASGWDS